MAHEIRNPLAAIMMHSFYLAERLKDDEENLQILADVNIAVERMQKLVKGILDFVRPDELRFVEEDLVDVLESALAALAARGEGEKVEIVRDYTQQNARVEVDVHQMVTVFLTLFDNAVRAMPNGGTITVRIENPRPETVAVLVEDTGVGIEGEDLERIFEPFFTRREDGIGLGLALVSRILAQHACQVEVESEPGRGTRFLLAFPLARSSEQTRPQSSEGDYPCREAVARKS
jgi:signal transduction histidine kinase